MSHVDELKPSREILTAIFGVIVVGILLLAISIGGHGPPETFNTQTTPTAACRATVSGNVATLEVVGITGPVVPSSDLTIYLRAPDTNLIAWDLASAGWVGNTTSFRSSELNCSITLTVPHSDLIWQFLDVGSLISIEPIDGLGHGSWTLAIYYTPTDGLVSQTSFEAP